jgi:hypothetical protein
MAWTYYDKLGEGEKLFEDPNKVESGVPITAVKRAYFKDALGKIHTLFKIIYNSTVYDFRKNAENGAVIFKKKFGKIEFVAPDNRLDFEAYTQMTIGEVISAIKAAVEESAIPAWEYFSAYIGKNEELKTIFDGLTSAQVESPANNRYNVNTFSLYDITNFSQLLDKMSASFTLIKDEKASEFIESYGNGTKKRIRFKLKLTINGTLFPIEMIFQE